MSCCYVTVRNVPYNTLQYLHNTPILYSTKSEKVSYWIFEMHDNDHGKHGWTITGKFLHTKSIST